MAGPFQNGVRPGHMALLLVFLILKQSGFTIGLDSNSTTEHGAVEHGGEGHDAHGHAEPELRGDDHGGHGHGHGYTVFHVDFERVQLPFIISLWIFVSSLAKIGECNIPMSS